MANKRRSTSETPEARNSGEAPMGSAPAEERAESLDDGAIAPQEQNQREPQAAPQEPLGSESALPARLEEKTDAELGNEEEFQPQGAAIEEIAPSGAQEPELDETDADLPAEVESVAEPLPAIESPAQAKRIIEALLFASGEAVSARRMAHTLGLTVDKVRELMKELAGELDRQERGIHLQEVAGGYQLATRPETADWVLRLLRQRRRSPLSGAALETLAIIAYKQPVLRAEIDAIRGVESAGVVRTLLDLGLIEVKGHKEVIGRPQLYGTTETFLRAFGLRRLEDLPSILELRERYELRLRT